MCNGTLLTCGGCVTADCLPVVGVLLTGMGV